MFAVLFSAIVLEMLASMGTFGALVAQNLFTNSASGWYVRLDWTAVYSYAVSILSVIITLCLAIGGLARGARGNRGCGLLFSPFAIFVLGFIFSVLWVVIAGFAYRNPLPMHYPCDIFRHLRNSLEMLGMASGKSLIEEGGLLVGICQSSKAFLVLSGMGLGLWILILVSSCAAMATGLDPKKKADASSKKSTTSRSSGSSIRSALSRLRRHGATAQQLPVPATYPDPRARPIARTPSRLAYPQPTAVRDQASGAAGPKYEHKRQPAFSRPRQAPATAQPDTQPAAGYPCTANCAYHGTSYQPQYVKNAPTSAPPVRRDTGTSPIAPEPHAATTAPRTVNLNSAFASGGYSRDISPRPAPRPQHEYRQPSPHKAPSDPIDDDSREMGGDIDDEHYDRNGEYPDHYSPEDGHEYDDGYIHHHHHIPPHPQSPESHPSRRQRLRQIFNRDATEQA
ncbi:hypothetical protein H4S02_005186 [Coemansia sp. RSA 2611]|nr:hypothetical protein H4S01_000984 [Coemansia sp. RSA 2610]KAJ2383677.1 hypothetical protein H4S02_005186 [Coemansia sp. RSA 2611]